MPLKSGKILNRRYRIDKLLGQGGFGTVYYAWDLNIDCPCVVKENLDTSDKVQEHFMFEAKVLHNLSHTNLPRVNDYFAIPGKGQYLVMEYIEGENLRECLENAGAPLPEESVLNWLSQICSALGYLHSQKIPIIHRDIKPSNIIVTPQRMAILVDFGISEFFDPSNHTKDHIKGISSGYSPPEQYACKTDISSDIYALGSTLYHLLTGQKPLESVLYEDTDVLKHPREINPKLSEKVENAVLKCMEMAPESRFQNVTELMNELDLWTNDGEKESHLDNKLIKISKLSGWKRVVVVLILLFIGSFAIIVIRSASINSSQTQIVSSTPVMIAVQEHTKSIYSTIIPTLHISVTPRYTIPPTSTLTPTETRQTSTYTLTNIPPTSTTLAAPSNEPLITQTPEGLNAVYIDRHGIQMNVIPAGSFQIGSEIGDADEIPIHTVYLNAFYIDLTEVTNVMYGDCVMARTCSVPMSNSSITRVSYYGNHQYDNYPVINVTWKQALDFCKWRGARLPYEAEWEKAARGIDLRIYSWGNAFEGTFANFCDKNCILYLADNNYNDGYSDTSPVASYSQGVSPYGLFNMVGNVWEWVMDWYSETFYQNSPSMNPIGPPMGMLRVVRGGSWNSPLYSLRVANRYSLNSTDSNNQLGFRCARTP